MKRNVTIDRSWSTWVGSTDDLRRVLSQFEALVADRKSRVLSESIGDSSEPKTDGDKQREERLRRFIEKEHLVLARIEYPDETVISDIETILAEFDRRKYINFRVFMGDGERDTEYPEFHDFSIQWTRRHKETYSLSRIGVLLHITSSDRGWAMQSVAQLSDELTRAQPSWRWLYSSPGRLVFLYSILVPLILLAASILSKTPFSAEWSAALLWQQVALIGSVAFLLIVLGMINTFDHRVLNRSRLLNRAFPPVEILAVGESPSGSKTAGFILGVVVVPTVLALAIQVLA